MDDWLKLFLDPAKQTNIIFLGGEPTLHPDLAHGVKLAQALGYQSITIDTNGFLLHNLLDNISPQDAVISFSLDGPNAEINDPLRGKGVFATCTANLRRAISKGFTVSVIYTVSRLNINHLPEMIPLLVRLKVARFFIQVIGIRGKSATKNETKLQLTQQEWLSVIPEVAQNAAHNGIHVTYPKVFLEQDDLFECGGNVAENYFIFPNGRVYLCPLCEDLPINTFQIENNCLLKNQGMTENMLFALNIAEGCVMNKLLQPDNIQYDSAGHPLQSVSCCLLKQEINPNRT